MTFDGLWHVMHGERKWRIQKGATYFCFTEFHPDSDRPIGCYHANIANAARFKTRADAVEVATQVCSFENASTDYVANGFSIVSRAEVSPAEAAGPRPIR